MDVDAMAEALALLHHPDATAGRVPAAFRETTHNSAVKELKALATQCDGLAKLLEAGPAVGDMPAAVAERLAGTIGALHQTAILALADSGFLERHELGLIATIAAAGVVSEISRQQIGILRSASAAARRATTAAMLGGKQPKISTRGAPENGRATAATEILFSSYKRITGKDPRLTVDALKDGHPASGDFFQLVKTAFKELNIDASEEAYIRKVLGKRRAQSSSP